MKKAEILMAVGVTSIPVVLSSCLVVFALVDYWHPPSSNYPAYLLIAFASLVVAAALGLITGGILLVRKGSK